MRSGDFTVEIKKERGKHGGLKVLNKSAAVTFHSTATHLLNFQYNCQSTS